MSEQLWSTYEEVAACLLNQFSDHFGVGRFEGKQIVPGDSGTVWEIDAKGCSDDGNRVIVVECKRHTKAGISQAITSSLAWIIQDISAEGGILVSPIGLQDGAKKVAAKAGIVEVLLDQNSTTTDYVLSFLSQIHVGFSDGLNITDHLSIEIRDNDGNIVEMREC